MDLVGTIIEVLTASNSRLGYELEMESINSPGNQLHRTEGIGKRRQGGRNGIDTLTQVIQ